MYSVVVIDDNKIAVTAIVKATNWESFHCQVTGVAYDGIAGLELIHKKNPDIVIIDIQMPGFNGLDIIEKIKQQRQDMHLLLYPDTISLSMRSGRSGMEPVIFS